MTEHEPLLVELSADGSYAQWIECKCGAIAHLGTGWEISARDRHVTEQLVILKPSVDYRGHFHTANPTGPIRVGKVGERNTDG